MIGRNVDLGSREVRYEQVDPKNLKFTVIEPFSKKGMDLDDFISQYKDRLKANHRVFYVISPNSEDVYKIGIAGDSDGKAIGRFEEYYRFYGSASNTNKCTGAIVHFVCATKFNKNVEKKRSFIFKLELKIKQNFKKSKNIERGDEWINASLDQIKDVFNEKSGAIREMETVPRRSNRLKFSTKRFVIEELLKIKKVRGKKEILVKWEGYDKTTWQPYDTIIRDAPKMVEDLERNIEIDKLI